MAQGRFTGLVALLVAAAASTTVNLHGESGRRRPLAVLSYEKAVHAPAALDAAAVSSKPQAETVLREERESLVFTPRGDSHLRAQRWNSSAEAGRGEKLHRLGGATGSDTRLKPAPPQAALDGALLFVHIAKTGGSSFDEILKLGVNGVKADCIVEKKHYEDKSTPLEERYNFPSCKILSTEFSRPAVTRFLVPRTKAKVAAPPPSQLQLSHVLFLTLMREPYARLLSQYRHDKFYTPRRFKDCAGLEMLVEHGASCIMAGEPAYR